MYIPTWTLFGSIREVFVAKPVHRLYSQNYSQPLINKRLDVSQRGLVSCIFVFLSVP